MKLTILTLASLGLVLPAVAQTTVTTDTANVPTTVMAVPFVQIPLPSPVKPKKLPSELGDIVRARFPLSIGFEDLGAGWREISWNDDVYFSKGDALFVNENEYLVTYHATAQANVRELTEREYISYVVRGTQNLRPGMRLQISLLPMGEVQSVLVSGNSGVKSFDPDDYRANVTLPTSDAFNQNLSLVFLRKMGEAFTAYSTANLQVLPPLDNATVARQNLEPFAENGAIFLQPGSRAPFRFNPILSGRKRAHLKGKGYFVLAYEGEAASDGSRAVLRLNGSVLRADEKLWRKLKEASKID
ncbi:MAG TPA: hypothetical protein VF719_07470 [Abditibacteriaceae bacterium]|jgi:hypothetical protein